MPGQSILERIERFELRSAAGTAYTISVSRPDAKRVERKLPIFLVLDADFLFGGAAETVGISHYGHAVVVGIGFGASYTDAVDRRMKDFQPATGDGEAPTPIEMAERFLAFITDTVIPTIVNRYPDVSTDRAALFGHSLMGFFAAYALLYRPETFASYLISSPSLWWDGFHILRELQDETRQRAMLRAEPGVFVCVGGREEDHVTVLPNHPSYDVFDLPTLNGLLQQCRMVGTSTEFAAALRGIGLTRVDHHVFADEDHMSVVPAALSRAARFALG